MASILKVDTIQDQDGNNIINESANTITIGASGDTITIPSGATLSTASFSSTGIDDNADATAITIDSSERVGIGTASPGAKLEIQTGSDWGNIINSTYAGTQYLQQFEYNGTSIGRIRGDNSSISIESGSNLILQTVNTERMRINSTGNVGIGTSSPTFLNTTGSASSKTIGLYNSGTATSQRAELQLGNAATASGNLTSGVLFGCGASDTTKNTLGSIFGIIDATSTTTASGALTFWTAASGSGTNTERMRIDSSGNIGIGTNAPIHEIVLSKQAGTINDDPTFQIINRYPNEGNNVGYSNRALTLLEAGNGTVITRIQTRYDTGANLGEIGTQTSHDFRLLSANAERMRITSSGFVGIGTTAPSAILEVNSGTGGSDGNFKLAGYVLTTKAVALTTSFQDLLQVGNRSSFKITGAVADASGGGVSGYTIAYVSCSNDTATQGDIDTVGLTATIEFQWKAASGTSADAHTLQVRTTSGSTNQLFVVVETFGGAYASGSSGTGNGQFTFLL
jgi:hypothetical protein